MTDNTVASCVSCPRMQNWGLNTYLYGPKDDLKHRLLWREVYSPEEEGKRFLFFLFVHLSICRLSLRASLSTQQFTAELSLEFTYLRAAYSPNLLLLSKQSNNSQMIELHDKYAMISKKFKGTKMHYSVWYSANIFFIFLEYALLWDILI